MFQAKSFVKDRCWRFEICIVGLLLSYLMASDTPSIPRVAILDDYQGVALSSADWTPLKGRVVIDVFRDTILDEDGLVRRLEGYDIICAMRERTKFPRSLLDRLPKLQYVHLHSLRQCYCLT